MLHWGLYKNYVEWGHTFAYIKTNETEIKIEH